MYYHSIAYQTTHHEISSYFSFTSVLGFFPGLPPPFVPPCTKYFKKACFGSSIGHFETVVRCMERSVHVIFGISLTQIYSGLKVVSCFAGTCTSAWFLNAFTCSLLLVKKAMITVSYASSMELPP